MLIIIQLNKAPDIVLNLLEFSSIQAEAWNVQVGDQADMQRSSLTVEPAKKPRTPDPMKAL